MPLPLMDPGARIGGEAPLQPLLSPHLVGTDTERHGKMHFKHIS